MGRKRVRVCDYVVEMEMKQKLVWRLKLGFGVAMKPQGLAFSNQLDVRSLILLAGLLVATAEAQKEVVKPTVPTVEPGLEDAVKWKWKVEPGDEAAWGIPIDLPTPAPTSPGTPQKNGAGGVQKNAMPVAVSPPEESLEHEVVRGDALAIIGRRYGVTVEQIKIANQMERDLIRIGQKLRIPSRAEVEAMKPPPPPPPPPKVEAAKPTVTVTVTPPKEEVRQAVVAVKYSRPPNAEAQRSTHVVMTQAFLDRKLFSTGPIDGSDGAMHQAAIAAYKTAYPDELVWTDGKTPPVILAMGGAYREYTLRLEDFRWIAPQTGSAQVRSGSKSGTAKDPDPTWEQLTQGTFLPYRSAWEFVAERYHCSEGFLRRINATNRSIPKAGTLFLVPNVEPFEMEKAFMEPIRPAVDPAAPVGAKIVNNAWLEIRKADKLVARVPVSAARPGLRGRGTWKILDAIARPKLVCLGEWTQPPKAVEVGLSNEVVILKPPPLGAILPPGPNNPVGPFWVNLAKGNDATPLPYGLHGTSIPGYLTRQESVGGFRLTNWDLVRVLRLLPVGTELKWE